MDKTMEFKKLVANYTDVTAEEMTNEMRFREDLNFSSLDFMSLLGEIEDQFDVELEESEALEIRTIGEAVDMLERLA